MKGKTVIPKSCLAFLTDLYGLPDRFLPLYEADYPEISPDVVQICKRRGWIVDATRRPAGTLPTPEDEFGVKLTIEGVAEVLKNMDSVEPADTRPQAEPVKPKAAKLKWLATAMLLRHDHPDWSHRRIAKGAGVHVSTLYRNDIYKAATSLEHAGNLPSGHIDGETGEIEAYDRKVPKSHRRPKKH